MWLVHHLPKPTENVFSSFSVLSTTPVRLTLYERVSNKVKNIEMLIAEDEYR